MLPAEQELLNLSKQKSNWMSERNVDALAALFDEQAVFVHMGATMADRAETMDRAYLWHNTNGAPIENVNCFSCG